MPKNEINYEKTIIYKIQSQDHPELIYIGHTTDFTRRKCQHRLLSISETSKKSHLKVYKMIRDNGGWEMFNMVQIKEFSCSNRREAVSEEDKCMTEFKATLNTFRSFSELTPEEYAVQYRATHKEEKQSVDRQYREANRESIKAHKKEYREANSEKIKAHRQEYIENNKEKIKAQQKEYYQKNRIKIIQQQKERDKQKKLT